MVWDGIEQRKASVRDSTRWIKKEVSRKFDVCGCWTVLVARKTPGIDKSRLMPAQRTCHRHSSARSQAVGEKNSWLATRGEEN